MNNNITVLYKVFEKFPRVVTDTRLDLQGAVFFALKGTNFNGNAFAIEALNKGAALAVVDDNSVHDVKGIFKVPDSLTALQELATHHRLKMKAKVLGITGSNGKTTTKELVREVLAQKFNVNATEGNLNNHIGVPLTLLKINELNEIAIVEMGANHQNEIAELCQIAQPDYGLITNFGKAHLEGFGGFKGVIIGKSEMYDYLRSKGALAFVNQDDELLMQQSQGLKRYCYGQSERADINGQLIKSDGNLTFAISGNEIETNLIGSYNFSNAMAAVAIGSYFKVDNSRIIEALKNYQPEMNRSQRFKSNYNELILDAYNANPTSVEAALRNFSTLKSSEKLVILGEMLELGDTSHKEHWKIIQLLNDLNLKSTLFVGNEFRSLSIDPDSHYSNVDELKRHLVENPVKGKTILLKGSRGNQLEKLIEVL